jgi:hypothetical protein
MPANVENVSKSTVTVFEPFVLTPVGAPESVIDDPLCAAVMVSVLPPPDTAVRRSVIVRDEFMVTCSTSPELLTTKPEAVGVMLWVAVVKLPEVKVSVYAVPAVPLMPTLVKVATPATALTVVVPTVVPSPLTVMVTAAVLLVTVLPKASLMVMTGWVVKAEPLAAPAAFVVSVAWLAAPKASEVTVTCAEPLTYPVRVVVTVAVDDVLAATPLTVIKPLPDIATVPPAVADPP